MGKIRVLLVDDHPVVRDGLRRMLEVGGGVEVVGEAASGQEALAKAESLSPEIILMDIQMPGMDGIEAMRRLREKGLTSRVIVLTVYGEKYLGNAIEAGAVGYLQKDVTARRLREAIRAVHRGESFVDPSLSRQLFAEFASLAKERLGLTSFLSPRQLEILRLLARGATNKEIAAQLFISPTTTKRELRRIFEKLGVRHRAEAVAEAHRKELL